MWIAHAWKCEEDVLRDLHILSEVPLSSTNSEVPETILKYRKQIEENKLRMLNSDIDESASYIISGRGRGIRDRVIRPGGIVDCHPSDETELKKQIRQVAGFGYSNGLIEQSIKAKGYDPGTNKDTKTDFKFVSRSSSNSRSPSATRKKLNGSVSGSNSKN